jgi:hypothetical protein
MYPTGVPTTAPTIAAPGVAPATTPAANLGRPARAIVIPTPSAVTRPSVAPGTTWVAAFPAAFTQPLKPLCGTEAPGGATWGVDGAGSSTVGAGAGAAAGAAGGAGGAGAPGVAAAFGCFEKSSSSCSTGADGVFSGCL